MSADIRPLVTAFVGERYAATEELSKVIAPPYDVIDAAERERLALQSPHNVVRVNLPEAGDDCYDTAARLLSEWRKTGVLVPDPGPMVTVLRQTFTIPLGTQHERTGVIGGVVAESFARGRVKPHEQTHAGPKKNRLALLRATSTMFEALLMFSRDQEGRLLEELRSVTDEVPAARAELQGVGLEVWPVEGVRAEELAAVAGRDAIYIGDGHHRYETATAYGAENPAAERVPTLVVSCQDPGLVALPTFRLISGTAIEPDAILALLQERFQVHQLASQSDYLDELHQLHTRGTACVVVLPGGRAYALLLKSTARLGELPSANEPTVASLDVARVDALVVKDILAAAGSDGRVDYSPYVDIVIREVEAGRAAAGVLINPTSIDQVLAVADAGAAMPPKSTYFTPKVPGGIVGMRYGS
jgi:uncharacterized protein (DUF1015 family)